MNLTAPERPRLDTGDSLLHGAHLECQQDRPTVKAVCGVECEWDEMDLTRNDSLCIVCEMTLLCPICGTRLAASA